MFRSAQRVVSPLPLAALLLLPALVWGPVLPSQAESTAQAGLATVEAEEGTFGSAVEIEARVVPIDMVEIRIEPKRYGGPFEVVEARPSGPVAAGETLLRFKTEEIDRQLERERVDLELAATKFEQAEVGHGQRTEELRLELEDAQRALRIAKEELERFETVERKMRTAEAELGMQSMRDNLQNQEEELAQLVKMYQEDDLTEETEEIVLRRTRRGLERSHTSFGFRELRHAWYLENSLPREHENLQVGLAKQRLRSERAVRLLDLQKREADLARTKARLELDAKKRSLAELEDDRDLLSIQAPRAGLAVTGIFEGGRWKNIPETDPAYKPGDRLTAKQVLYTLVEPSHVRLAGTIAQKELAEVIVGRPVWFTSDVADKEVFQAEVEFVRSLPRDDKFDVHLRLARGDVRLVAGRKVKATVLGKSAPVAVHIPVASVVKEKDERFVYVREAAGFAWRAVKLGDTIGDRVAVTEGLAKGEAIAVAPPKRPEAPAKAEVKDEAKAAAPDAAQPAKEEGAAAEKSGS